MVFGYESFEIVVEYNLHLQDITFITKEFKLLKGFTS